MGLRFTADDIDGLLKFVVRTLAIRAETWRDFHVSKQVRETRRGSWH